MEQEELKKIKKNYGEEMMHLCRKLFPTLLEQPNLVYNILKENIAFTKTLASEIIENNLEEEFKNYIYSFIDVEKEFITTNKTPEELLKEKGYILYECKSEGDIQRFRKYYSKGEELCTFNGKRLDKCYVFFAIKENVEEIRREYFKNPKRQDLYGTSVISIQFSRGNINTLSIKNRYNHAVNNPDATYGNNLENIIPGLTASFENYYGLNINQNTNNYYSFLTDELKYVKGNDNKYYRYNYEIDNIYYCEDNIIIDNGNVIDKYNKEKERYILIDYFIVDRKEKKIELYDNNIQDSFIDSINEIGNIKDIKLTKDKIVIIKYEDLKEVYIGLDKTNNIISYKNDYIKNIEGKFLCYNKNLTIMEIPKVESIGDYFLYNNEKLITIELSSVQNIENNFLYYNKKLINIEIPKVESIGYNFLYKNKNLTKIELPKAKKIGDYFLFNNKNLEVIELPKAKGIGFYFLYYNRNLTTIELPEVEIIENSFLYNNENLTTIELPKVKSVGDDFLYNNKRLTYIELPEVESIGDYFLYYNKNLTTIELPKVQNIGYKFLFCNQEIEVIKLPKVKSIGNYFLWVNENINQKLLIKEKVIKNEKGSNKRNI